MKKERKHEKLLLKNIMKRIKIKSVNIIKNQKLNNVI